MGRASRALRWIIGCVAIIVVALAGGVHVWATPEWVERIYLAEIYPRIRSALVFLVGRAPMSVAELLLASAVLGLVAVGVMRVREYRRGAIPFGRIVATSLGQLLFAATFVYAAFVLLWGINYQRVPLAKRLQFDVTTQPTALELLALYHDLEEIVTELRPTLPESSAGVIRLTTGREGVAEGIAELLDDGVDPTFRGPMPTLRFPLVSPIMSRFGISGIFSPFTGEPHVNAEIPDSQVPFVGLHETAHAAGFAREDEANFMAWRAGSRSSRPEFRYSAALVALGYVLRGIASGDSELAQELEKRLPEAVRRDRSEVRAFWRSRYSSLSKVTDRVNDAWLRGHGSARGIQSYGDLVRHLVASRRSR